MLYRVFPVRPGAGPHEDGGVLYVSRAWQGTGRHDNPEHYGALYVSRSPESAVAERIQAFRGRELLEANLRRADGRRYALAEIDDAALSGDVIDLDDPRELVRRRLRPSSVATRRRPVTRPLALSLFEEGVAGFAWWSTLEAQWMNVTLFAERSGDRLSPRGEPQPLTLDLPVFRTAADAVGVLLRG